MKILKRKFLDVKTKTCHASTTCFYYNKQIFAWFGGTVEGDADSSIYVQVGKKVHVLESKHRVPLWNPILFPYDSRLFLFVKAGIFCDRWQTFIMDISNVFEEDFDIAAVRMEVLPAGLNGPVKTKPIVHEGLIYCGSSVETIYDWTSYIESYVYASSSNSLVFVSRTNPLTVPKTTYKDPYYGSTKVTSGIIQPSLWVDTKGRMNAFFRASRGLGRVYYSHSEDTAHDLWSTPVPTKFENPNSGVDTVFINGRLFLVYNPNSDKRIPLVVAEINNDLFEPMETLVINETIPEEENTHSLELSYPYMIENNGKLHLTYTYGRSKIEHVEIKI